MGVMFFKQFLFPYILKLPLSLVADTHSVERRKIKILKFKY